MKICYLDETGTGQHDVVVIVGVTVDIHRMHLTKLEWKKKVAQISKLARRPVNEIHAKHLIPGRNQWSGVDGNKRKEIVDGILDWFAHRAHKITFSAIDTNRFRELGNSDRRKEHLANEWNAAAFHIMLSVQKWQQSNEKTKGHTVFVFDIGKPPDCLISLLLDPPDWSDQYYDRGKKQEQLNQIVDVPLFARSHHIGLIQIADLVCYILRRYSLLIDYGKDEDYSGELHRYQALIEKVGNLCIDRRFRYLKRGGSDTARFFRDLAPQSLRAI